MQITISGGVEQIQERIDKLRNLHARCNEIMRRLCEVGEPIIRATHGGHAVITTEKLQSNEYIIKAEGQDVLFIEFGTGDMAGVLDGWYDKVPSVVRPGSWSEQHARMWSRFGFWVFAGEIYHYTNPHPAFYDAYRAMVDALPQIASEVFSR